MFASFSRSAEAYRRVDVHTSVNGANSHQLITLLYDSLMDCLRLSRTAIEHEDLPTKGRSLSKAVRLINDGLRAALNDTQGGEVAASLRTVYDYSVSRLTQANLKNDVSAINEVIKLIEPLSDAWKKIGQDALAQNASQQELAQSS